MEYLRQIGKIDGMGERREGQFKHEHHFDTHVVPILFQQCGAHVVADTLLTRSKINRVMCRNIASTNLLKKLDMYNEFLDDVDKFNSAIDDAVNRNSKDGDKTMCKSLNEFNKVFANMSKYKEEDLKPQ